MLAATIICGTLAVMTACKQTKAQEGNPVQQQVVSSELIRTSQSWDGVELPDYLQGRPELVAGRSGFHVFRQHPNHLSILIQASMESRVERVMRKQNMTEEEARKTIERVDKMRENYVKKYTGTSRYDTRNYQLVITADGKTEEDIADLIMRYIG